MCDRGGSQILLCVWWGRNHTGKQRNRRRMPGKKFPQKFVATNFMIYVCYTPHVWRFFQSAITSLETVLVVCRDSWDAKKCSRDCVAAWNSLIRDVETMVGQKCVELEIRMNSFFPKTFSGDSTFGQDELVAFATCCVFICPVDTNYCGLTPHPVTKIEEFTGAYTEKSPPSTSI